MTDKQKLTKLLMTYMNKGTAACNSYNETLEFDNSNESTYLLNYYSDQSLKYQYKADAIQTAIDLLNN